MDDDLRTRIAAVLSQHDAFGTDFVECLCGAEFDNAQVILNEFQPIWELHVADAVIRELGLQQEFSVGDDEGGRTLWLADEEPVTPREGEVVERRWISRWERDE